MADTSMREQIRVLEVAEGFFQSSVLFALLKLDVFATIGEGTKPLNELASSIEARPETLARLLNAAVVFGMLESDDGVSFRVPSGVAAILLPSAGEHFLGDWLLNLDFVQGALSKLDVAVRTSGPTVDPTGHIGSDQSQTREFTFAMHNYAALRGRELARFLDTSGCTSLLDLGCGPGTYAFHLGAANPDLRLFLLDFPGVLEVAKEVQSRFELTNEVTFVPLDAVDDVVPGTYDLVLVSNTLHMLGERHSRDLIRRLYPTVNEGGSLVVQAQFLRDDRMGARWPVLLDLIQLCITSEGRNHSVAETKAWMEEAGFSNVDYCEMTLLNTNSFLRGYRDSPADR